MKLAIGNDHAAVEMKNEIVKYLEGKGYEIINVGTDTNESCNYAEYGEKVANLVASKEADYGVLICGTGVHSEHVSSESRRQKRLWTAGWRQSMKAGGTT